MSRVGGRFGSTREATVSWALPHLQPTTLPGTTAATPFHPSQSGPRRGGRSCNGPWRCETWSAEFGHAGQVAPGAPFSAPTQP